MSPEQIKRALLEGAVFAVVALGIQWITVHGFIGTIFGVALLGVWAIGFIVYVVFKYFGKWPLRILVAFAIGYTINHYFPHLFL